MARSKQNKSQTKKVDGKYRHETREERRARIQQQEEAREVRGVAASLYSVLAAIAWRLYSFHRDV